MQIKGVRCRQTSPSRPFPPCVEVGWLVRLVVYHGCSDLVPDQFTFLFKPAERFGACSTAQNGGYVNVATFNSQLDLSLGISLRLRMHETNEDIRYYYFLVEITQ